MKECICTKAHFKVPDWGIRWLKLENEKLVISNQRVYFKKGSVHIITEDTKGVDFNPTLQLMAYLNMKIIV